MAERDSTTETLIEKIQKAEAILKGMAGTSYLGEQLYPLNDDRDDCEPWNESDLLSGFFSGIRRQAGEVWYLIDEVLQSLHDAGLQASKPQAAAEGGV